MIIRKLNELSVNYKKLQGNNEERTAHYISIKKDRNNQHGKEEIKNTISELKNTVEGIKNMLDEAED